MTSRLVDAASNRSSGPSMVPIGTLPGMKPNAPRRNVLILLAYALVFGSLYWVVSTVLGFL